MHSYGNLTRGRINVQQEWYLNYNTDTLCTVPDHQTPSGLKASPSTTYITVSWGVQDADTFKVEYSLAGADDFSVASDSIDGGETRYRITGLTVDTMYDIRVTATKNGLESGSGEITQTTSK